MQPYFFEIGRLRMLVLKFDLCGPRSGIARMTMPYIFDQSTLLHER